MDTRPIAYLTIVDRGRMTSYRLCDGAGRLLCKAAEMVPAPRRELSEEELQAIVEELYG